MAHRLAILIGMLAVVAAIAQIPPLQVAGQSPAAGEGDPDWTPPRTDWGDPDLQGIWTSGTSTPLERPDSVAGNSVLSDEEAADFADARVFDLDRDRRDGGNAADVNRAYNEHWMDANRLRLTDDQRTSLIVDPPDGRIPPPVALSPERQRQQDAAAAATARFRDGMPLSYRDFSLPVRCVVRTDRPPYIPTIYNNTQQIFQSPGYVVILVEMIHSARIIPVDGRPHLGPTLPQWLGDTRGHWEGDTLVLETTNFRNDPGVTFRNSNPETFKVVERLTRVDADTIGYEFTVEDPVTWTRPWSAMIPWNKTDDQLYEYACHEDNYDAVHFLTGARRREQEAEGN